MRINLNDPRVSEAIKVVKSSHKPQSHKEFEQVFEEHYHCKIIVDPTDQFCLFGELEISEAKYETWFTLQFGG